MAAEADACGAAALGYEGIAGKADEGDVRLLRRGEATMEGSAGKAVTEREATPERVQGLRQLPDESGEGADNLRYGCHLSADNQQVIDEAWMDSVAVHLEMLRGVTYERTDKPLDPADEWVTGSVEEFLKLAAESGARVDELS